MKQLGQIRKMYATIEWCPAYYSDPPGISRFAGLDAWCSTVELWKGVMDGAPPYHAMVGLKESVWDEAG